MAHPLSDQQREAVRLWNTVPSLTGPALAAQFGVSTQRIHQWLQRARESGERVLTVPERKHMLQLIQPVADSFPEKRCHRCGCLLSIRMPTRSDGNYYCRPHDPEYLAYIQAWNKRRYNNDPAFRERRKQYKRDWDSKRKREQVQTTDAAEDDA